MESLNFSYATSIGSYIYMLKNAIARSANQSRRHLLKMRKSLPFAAPCSLCGKCVYTKISMIAEIRLSW